MVNFIVAGIILVILGSAGYYIYREKKNGTKCVGCPHAKTCGSCNCGCGQK